VILSASPIPGNEKWSAISNQMRALANEVIHSNDPAVQTQAMVRGVSAVWYRDMYQKALKEVARLQNQLKGVVGAAPHAGNGPTSSGGGAGGGKIDKTKSFAEQMVDKARAESRSRT
jgi:hypothetical protein